MFPKAQRDLALLAVVLVESFFEEICGRIPTCGRPYIPFCI
jgi:hypothetical protein